MNFQMERQHLQNSMGRFAFVFRNLLWPEFKLPLRHGPVFQRVSKTVFSEKIINLNHFMIHIGTTSKSSNTAQETQTSSP